MYKIIYYRDKNGVCQITDYIEELSVKAEKGKKDARVNRNKIREYIGHLSEYGFRLGEPYIKHIDGEIWELRPIDNRVFFAAEGENGFLLLHQFLKTSQKTPRREIEQAKRELADHRERNKYND